MAGKGKSSDIKVRKKKWVEIISPSFNNRTVGETTVFDIENAIGKNLKINLMTLIGDPRKQNIDILFKTTEQKGETGVIAELQGLKIQQPALKKLVRRGKSKIQSSFKCYTSDKKPIVIKGFTISRNVVNMSTASRIRMMVKQLAINKASEMKFEDFIQNVINNKIQKEISSVVGKVYPLRIVEFNTVHLTQEKGAFEKQGEIPAYESGKKKKKAKPEDEEAENDSKDESSDAKKE